jgi:hypothetical protein
MEAFRMQLPSGASATETTLAAMADAAHYAATTEKMRETAIDIVRSMYCGSPSDYVQAVDMFCRRSIMLIHEADEILIDPLKMLADIEQGRAAGDCDDVAMLSAALLFSLGIETRFKAVFPHEAGHYQHVFTEYRLVPGGPWMPLDSTIGWNESPEYPPDWIIKEV